MSLTSYRAAPPRVGMSGSVLETAKPPLLPFRGCWGGFYEYWLFDRLEDLAATYSPVP